MKHFFSETGVLSKIIEQYEFRAPQLEMAHSVQQAVENHHNLIVEAGTGVGKSLAYLLPLAELEANAIVSTATKVLQHQLFEKDLPVVEDAVGRELSVAVLKGRSNYFCIRRYMEFEGNPLFEQTYDIPRYKIIREWQKLTETGEFSELMDIPLRSGLLRQLNADRNYCTGSKCPFYDDCFFYKARKRALNSQIVLVNHHLLFSDFSVKETNYGTILPMAQVLVVDEAHSIEDIASSQFASLFTPRMVGIFLSELPPELKLKYSFEVKEMLKSSVLHRKLTGDGRKSRIEKPLRDHFEKVKDQIDLIRKELKELTEDEFELKYNMIRRAEGFLSFFKSLDSDEHISFYENTGDLVFKSIPVDVSSKISNVMTENFDTVIMTSATLSVSGQMEFFRNRVGSSENTYESILQSPFDYNAHTFLYVPSKMPDVNSELFPHAAVLEIEHLAELFQGRIFVLCTSLKNVSLFSDYLKENTDFNIIVQGDGFPSALVERFKSEDRSILIGSYSFWEGVDIKGDALSCVTIDRLPFSQPSDPVFQVRSSRIQSSFMNYAVPLAVLQLKQGLGRLIRSSVDRGAFVILDSRLTDKFYGKVFMNSIQTGSVVRTRIELREAVNRLYTETDKFGV